MPLLAPGLLAAACMGFNPYVIRADDGTPRVDPAAEALLDEVAAAYRGLPAYADRGTLTLAWTVNGQRREQAQPMALALVRPGSLAVTTATARLICDGRTLAVVIEPTRSYLTEPAPERLTPATVTEGPLGAVLLGGSAGVPASILLNLLLADDPVRAILAGGVRLRPAPDAPVDGATHRVLVLDPGVGPEYQLFIDPDTKLVRRIELVVTPEALEAATPAGASLADAAIAWDAGSIATEAPAPETFSFEPPAGYSEVAELKAPAPAAGP